MADKTTPGCLLGKDASADCCNQCFNCGWNQTEHEHRIAAIRNGELQTDNDGLKRLHIKKEEKPTDAD